MDFETIVLMVDQKLIGMVVLFKSNNFLSIIRFVSQLCPEDDLTKHNPPLVYNLHTDPYEMYPLDDADVADMIEDHIQPIIDKHRKSLQLETTVEQQLGHYTTDVIPCCGGDYPNNCYCDQH